MKNKILVTGSAGFIDFQPMQQGDVQETFADIDKSVEMHGNKHTTNIDVGLKEFIDWYENNVRFFLNEIKTSYVK